MNMEPEGLPSVFDGVFARIGKARGAFTPQLRPHEVGTITSVTTGIAKVSGLPGVGFERTGRVMDVAVGQRQETGFSLDLRSECLIVG